MHVSRSRCRDNTSRWLGASAHGTLARPSHLGTSAGCSCMWGAIPVRTDPHHKTARAVQVLCPVLHRSRQVCVHSSMPDGGCWHSLSMPTGQAGQVTTPLLACMLTAHTVSKLFLVHTTIATMATARTVRKTGTTTAHTTAPHPLKTHTSLFADKQPAPTCPQELTPYKTHQCNHPIQKPHDPPARPRPPRTQTSAALRP